MAGDLIIDKKLALADRHDLSTAAGRRMPGIIVFGAPEPDGRPTDVCEGHQHVNGSGRLVMCEESTLTVDGLIYTRDGMAIEPKGYVDQVGAMYHNNRETPNPSFTLKNATMVLRFDPLALSAFGKGIAVLSWQQLH